MGNFKFPILSLIVLAAAMLTETAAASGISVDAGLTPPEDRWIIRTQFRRMRRGNDPTAMNSEMETFALPLVVAYGYSPDLMLMVKQVTKFRNMEMGMTGETTRDSGLDDIFLLGKYKLFRRNTRDYTFGLAATLGVELPTGTNGFSSHTVDLRPGMFASWRSGPWASDLNFSYKWNGFADRGTNSLNPGDELALDFALGHQFSIDSDNSLTPVVELSYSHTFPDRRFDRNLDNTGRSTLYLSPGIKLTMSSFIIEALVQFPVWQDNEGNQLKQKPTIIIGTRFMF